MQLGKIYVSELSTSKHAFHNYHFCRGNSNQRKTRIGLIQKGRGTYIYLNKKLNVNEGDIVFDPCSGSGSHLLVAKENNRQWLGVELNREYFNIASERVCK